MTPAEIKSLETYLRKTFELNAIDVRKRQKKEDSVEVFVKEEFIGIIYKEAQEDYDKVRLETSAISQDAIKSAKPR